MINNKQKTATVAVINRDKRILILQRGETAPYMPLSYCLPGGHLELNESLIDGAVRELFEETGLIYPAKDLIPFIVKYKDGFNKNVWIAHISSAKIELNWEHIDYQWVSMRESSLYPLVRGLKTTIKTLHGLGHVI